MRCRSSTGAKAANKRNGTSTSAAGQANTASVTSTAAGTMMATIAGADGMGVEIFDCLDVLRRQRDQIAGAAAQQIAGRQRIELAEQRDAHVGEQVIGHGVRLPRLGPVQNAGERRDDGEPDQQDRRTAARS